MSVLFYGDPHGEWRPLLHACAEDRPDGVVILGDCDLAMPLRQQLRPIFDAGIGVRWIPGNHDVNCPEFYDRLWGDYPEGNLHARSHKFGELLVAGLGGVFHGKIWYPRTETDEPLFSTRRKFLDKLPRTNRWRDDMPLKQRAAIFPEDIDALRGLSVDVLATHEAPSSHRHGFVGIDLAAAGCGARLIVHGHHHQSYAAVLPDGTRVQGLGKADVVRLGRGDLT